MSEHIHIPSITLYILLKAVYPNGVHVTVRPFNDLSSNIIGVLMETQGICHYTVLHVYISISFDFLQLPNK